MHANIEYGDFESALMIALIKMWSKNQRDKTHWILNWLQCLPLPNIFQSDLIQSESEVNSLATKPLFKQHLFSLYRSASLSIVSSNI